MTREEEKLTAINNETTALRAAFNRMGISLAFAGTQSVGSAPFVHLMKEAHAGLIDLRAHFNELGELLGVNELKD